MTKWASKDRYAKGTCRLKETEEALQLVRMCGPYLTPHGNKPKRT